MMYTKISNAPARLALLSLTVLPLGLFGLAHGHGALSGDADTCVLDIGPYKMHFTGYQPGDSGNTEFCEDIPGIGRTIIVLESIDDQLRDMQVAARVVAEDKGGAIEMEQPFRSNSRGSITLMHNFAERGQFTGLITVRSDDDDAEFAAEFPFSVGLPAPAADSAANGAGNLMVLWIALASVFLVVAALFVWRRRAAATP